jgi:hypothetical protein
MSKTEYDRWVDENFSDVDDPGLTDEERSARELEETPNHGAIYWEHVTGHDLPEEEREHFEAVESAHEEMIQDVQLEKDGYFPRGWFTQHKWLERDK